MKTWLITGCSSGFGRNLAETLLSEGEQVIVTARKPKTIQHFAKNYPLTALCLRLDVTKKDTIDATVNAAIENRISNTKHILTKIPPLHQNVSGPKSILTSRIYGSADVPNINTKNRIRDNILFQPKTAASSPE